MRYRPSGRAVVIALWRANIKPPLEVVVDNLEFTDINIISTTKKLDANDVFIYSAIIHISASQYCISNTAVTKIELFRAFKVFLTSDVVSLSKT